MIKEFKGVRPEIQENCFIAENATLIGDIRIGEQSSVWYGTVIRGDVAPIRIGRQTNIQDNSILHTDKGLTLTIGDHVTIGHGCIIHGASILGNSIIGMGSILLNGSEIGKNTMIGAGSLVTEGKKIPEGELWMGRPAKFVRKLTIEEIVKLENSAKHYFDYAMEHKGDRND
ncbi:gamma carbonic anhydrase family protein [Proteiniclasticum sp. C24MP]|uniref:gamma carbonic anhydrase family protein n=1 Tax=Proteiniclasticum sp. C24MP TaxID=3374101 RepID=UPI003753EFA1